MYVVVSLISISEEEVKTSVGRPTTLHVTVGGDSVPEISWTKDGEPINHVILSDGSLYILNTTHDDEGRYTVTAINNKGKSIKDVQLIALNPQFVQCKLYGELMCGVLHTCINIFYS